MVAQITKTRATPLGESGLSMVEVMVVALIIATLIAFTFPLVGNAIRAYNLRSAANHLAERLAATRALAMSKNRSITFSFNNTSGHYGFDFTGTDGDGVPDTTDPDDPSISYFTGTLPSGITATFADENPIKITFNSRGELPIGNTEKSIVIGNGRNSATVRVNLRGKISIQ